jgi:uncharacterized OsmC-like protein
VVLRAAKAVAQFTATNKAVVTLVGTQHSVASVRGFSGCRMRGPTPTDYFTVSLGAKTSSSCATRHWRIARRTHRGCPIYATLRKETAFTIRLIVDGQRVPF